MRRFGLGIVLLSALWSFPVAATSQAALQEACIRYQKQADFLECLFLKGLAAKRAGRFREAIEWFRRMLAIDPDLARVRLELAESYFRIENDTQAERHFRYALGSKLPPAVVQRVHAYLNAMRQRKRWAASFDFSITPESNVNRATSVRVVTAGGIPWTLTDDSRAKAGMRINASAGLLFRPYVSQDVRGHLRLLPSLTATTDGTIELTRFNVDDISLASWMFTMKVESGLVYLFDGGEISFGGVGGYSWYEGEKYYHTYGAWVRGMRELGRRTRLNADLLVERQKFASRWATKDAWLFQLTPGVRYQVSPSVALLYNMPLAWYRAQPKDKGYVSGGVSLGVDVILPYDFTLYVEGAVSRARFSDTDSVFGERRKDWMLGAKARLTWAKWKAFDLAPYLQYTYERRDSTIVLHEYDNHGLMIGFTKSF